MTLRQTPRVPNFPLTSLSILQNILHIKASLIFRMIMSTCLGRFLLTLSYIPFLFSHGRNCFNYARFMASNNQLSAKYLYLKSPFPLSLLSLLSVTLLSCPLSPTLMIYSSSLMLYDFLSTSVFFICLNFAQFLCVCSIMICISHICLNSVVLSCSLDVQYYAHLSILCLPSSCCIHFQLLSDVYMIFAFVPFNLCFSDIMLIYPYFAFLLLVVFIFCYSLMFI